MDKKENYNKYPKIHRLWVDETDGILYSKVSVHEKIDWANVSIWIDNNWLIIASRNLIIYENWITYNEFNWCVDYILNHKWINDLLNDFMNDNKDCILYGEWLVPHTVSYFEKSYHEFYLFDIWDLDRLMCFNDVYDFAFEYKIKTPKLFWEWVYTKEQLDKFVWKSELWEKWEWIVIKSNTFINKFWRPSYAKKVGIDFQETKCLKDWSFTKQAVELGIVDSCVTMSRVEKIIHKIEDESWEKISIKYIARILSSVYKDIIDEEMWEILKKHKNPIIEFKKLNRLTINKIKTYLVELWIL